MGRTTVKFGGALLLVGLIGYVAAGRPTLAALVPVVFGALIAVLGVMAGRERWRPAAVRAAMIVALIGFLGSLQHLTGLQTYLAGGDVERPLETLTGSVTAAITGLFVVVGAAYLIAARRRTPAAGRRGGGRSHG